ncbi:MAG: serine hydrolase [candidate division Zixibacteria bacterium]|nr:serine hydrolase [candidate division Zixibacteria bacterium]
MTNNRRFLQAITAFLVFLFCASPFSELSSQGRKRRPRRTFIRGATPESPGRLLAKAALIIDVPSGRILYEYNASQVRSIASLTKLMTAIVFLEGNPPLDSVVTVTREDARGAGRRRSQMGVGESFRLLDLLYASLMASDNRVTRTLARASGLSMDNFVLRMNEKARELELDSTTFVEVTGLDAGNRSTATDVARLLSFALENYWVAHITATNQYTFQSVNKRRRHILLNTNRLARAGWEVEGGKTGFIAASGYCLATILKDKEDHEILVTLLGAPTNSRRFSETIYIIDWLNRYVYPRQIADTTLIQE